MIHDLHLHQTLSIHTHFTPQSSPRLDSPRTYCTTEACPVLAIHDFRPILISSWIVLCSHPGPGFHHPPPPSIPCQVTRPENSGGRPLNKTSCVCCSVLSCSLLTLLSCACTCTCTPSPRWDCLKIKPPPPLLTTTIPSPPRLLLGRETRRLRLAQSVLVTKYSSNKTRQD